MSFMLATSVASSVWADPADVLHYERPSADRACHDGDWLRRELAARFGHDPFAWGALERRELDRREVERIVVQVSPEGERRRLRVRFVDGSGRDVFPLRSWPESWAPDQCEQIERLALHAMAVRMFVPRSQSALDAAAEVALDDAEVAVDADVDLDASTGGHFEDQEPTRVTVTVSGDVPPAIARESIALSATAAVGVVAGFTPAVTPTLRVGIWGARGWWRVGVELDGDLAIGETTEQGISLRGDRGLATVLGCGVWRWLSGCVMGRVGALWSSSGGRWSTVVPQLDLGVRLGAEGPVGGRWSLWGALEALVPLLPVKYESGAAASPVAFWRATVGGGALAGVRLRF